MEQIAGNVKLTACLMVRLTTAHSGASPSLHPAPSAAQTASVVEQESKSLLSAPLAAPSGRVAYEEVIVKALDLWATLALHQPFLLQAFFANFASSTSSSSSSPPPSFSSPSSKEQPQRAILGMLFSWSPVVHKGCKCSVQLTDELQGHSASHSFSPKGALLRMLSSIPNIDIEGSWPDTEKGQRQSIF